MAVTTTKPKKIRVLQHPAYRWSEPVKAEAYNLECSAIANVYGIEKLATSVRKRGGRKVESIVGGNHSISVMTDLGHYTARLLWYRVCPRPRLEHGCASEATILMKIEIVKESVTGALVGVGEVDRDYSNIIFVCGWADTAMETIECIYDHLQEALLDAFEEDWRKLPEEMRKD